MEYIKDSSLLSLFLIHIPYRAKISMSLQKLCITLKFTFHCSIPSCWPWGKQHTNEPTLGKLEDFSTWRPLIANWSIRTMGVFHSILLIQLITFPNYWITKRCRPPPFFFSFSTLIRHRLTGGTILFRLHCKWMPLSQDGIHKPMSSMNFLKSTVFF